MLRGQAGITFASVIFMVMIIGIMLAMSGKSWSRLMKREREEELLYRGTQIFRAISTWYRQKPGQPPTPLRELKDLCKDPRSLQTIRYLRCDPEKKDPASPVFMDPVSGKEFEVVKGPAGGIVGVISPSEAEPLKQANFPVEYKHFEGKKKYKEWLFVPKKMRDQLPQASGANPTGKIEMPPPFLKDERETPKPTTQ
jgi:type II secretory pathway pseudopilin PulG